MKFERLCSGLLVLVLLLVAQLGAFAAGDPAVLGVMPAAGDDVVRHGDGYRFTQNGWIYVHIEGEPYERGVQHGYLLVAELEDLLRTLQYICYWNTGKHWDFFVEAATRMFVPHLEPEYLAEIKGIADGAKAAGVDISWEDILTWNGYSELAGYWWPNEKAGKYAHNDHEGCSAFIATGSATADGKIVMAHNTWNVYELGQFCNVILDIEPANGHRMFMQSGPGYIHSKTDFALTAAGIVLTETTIGGFGQFDPAGAPAFLRVRRAMQYSDTLDQFVGTMLKDNNGGYANSWLLGDINTGEIMRFELGMKKHSVERTTDGYFIGFNAATDIEIRRLECSDAGYEDIRTPVGARRVRLTQLMGEYAGKIDVDVAEQIMADHYDVYLQQENHPGSRTIDGHYELDRFEYLPSRLPFRPMGSLDGKVVDGSLAEQLSFWARWGNSSGIPFDAGAFLAEHIQWSELDGYLKDRPTQPWTLFAAGDE